MDDIQVFAKNEKELETLIQTERIYSQDTEIRFDVEKCVMLIKKTEKKESVEWMKLPNQECIWMLGEKENCKPLGISETDNTKKVYKRNNKSTSEEWESFSKSNSAGEISSKGWTPEQSPS